MKRKSRIGSSLEDFLTEDGRLDDATDTAIKRVLAWQLEQVMKDQAISKAEMARRMRTSRSQLDRLLDPDDHMAVTLETMQRAASVLGKRVTVDLVDAPKA
ncbi:MAG: helix-turn-helix domain-containing protein [Gammaproteobacteria bacterium]